MTAAAPIDKAKDNTVASAGLGLERVGVLLVNLGTPDSADTKIGRAHV